MRTFKVDDVVAVETRMPESPFPLERMFDGKLLARSGSLERCVQPALKGGRNGLLLAVHEAFANHRPLTLSPDDVWMTILHGFAIHVRENAERLRARFVDFEGRKTLTVNVSSDADWSGNLRLFERALTDALNPGLLRAITSDFSTTTPDIHVAYCIAAMDTFQRYFDLQMMCVCGIPRITLTGTVDDWIAVRDRFRVLAEYDLQWWSKKLDPVLTQFIGTATGNVDAEFWQSIYKPKQAYGGNQITGWLVRLFPYLEANEIFVRNPFEARGWVHDPIHPDALPQLWCSAPLRLLGVGHEKGTLVSLNSGFFGAQQLSDASVAPLIGWTVVESSHDQLFDAIARCHSLEPSAKSGSWPGTMFTSVPSLLNAFSSRFGGATLFGGELRFQHPPVQNLDEGTHFDRPPFVLLRPPLPPDPRTPDAIEIPTGAIGLQIGALKDGRRLVFLDEPERVLLVEKDVANPPHTVIADSLLEFIQRLSVETPFPPWEIKGTWSPKS